MSRHVLPVALLRQPARGVACPIVWNLDDTIEVDHVLHACRLRPKAVPDGATFGTGAVTRDPDRGWVLRMSNAALPLPLWPATGPGIRLALMHDEQGERALCSPYACDPVGWWLDDE